ncbi:MAG: hypothetical protein QXE70_04260 [Ignisphaera sp.]
MKLRKIFISILLVLLFNIAISQIMSSILTQSTQQYIRIASISIKTKALGIYNNYLIGLSSTDYGTEISVTNLYTSETRIIAKAESIGLQPELTRFYETENHFVLFDGRLLLIFDRDTNFVGRFAGDNVKGFVILPSGNLVVWGKEYVAFARSPGYVSVTFYDIWETIYKLFNESVINAKQYLSIRGIDIDAEITKMKKNLYEIANSVHGNIVYEESNIFYDIYATTVREAKQKLVVDVVSAIVLTNNSKYVAVNVNVPITITLHGVIEYLVGEEIKRMDVDLRNSYPVSLGLLIRLNDNICDIIEVYDTIDIGIISSAMTYVYRSMIESLKIRFVRIIHEDGGITTIPIYFSGQITDSYVFRDLILLRLDTDIVLVYRNQSLLWSFKASRITDVGIITSNSNKLYISYLNILGAHELGVVDFYSGRVDKVSIDVPHEAVGMYIPRDNIIITVIQKDESAEIWIYTLASSIARVKLMFINHIEEPVSPIWGKATISVNGLRYSIPITNNPSILLVPTPSTIEVTVDAPYGRTVEKIDILKPAEHIHKVLILTKPSPEYISRGNILPFSSPFYLDHVFIRDTEILKLSLPGARYLDSYGTYVLLLHENRPREPSKLSLYSVDGKEIWSKIISSYITEARIFFPYIVIRSFSEIHILDLFSGATRGSVVMLVEGYDIDLDTDYLSVWNKKSIAVLDIRRGDLRFMNINGTVLAAPIIGGSIYAYIHNGDVVNIYIINPLTKNIVEILPLGAQTITSFDTDGRFKAVSYTIGDRSYTSVLSIHNGVVIIPTGPVAVVRSIGNLVNLPTGASTLYGNMFAVLLVSEDTSYTVYAMGMNYVKLFSLEGISADSIAINTLFIVERITPEDSVPILILRDFSGTPRVSIVPSIAPTIFTSSEYLIAYSDKNQTYIIPNPRVIGKYLLSIKVEDAVTWKAINSTIEIKEYGIKVDAVNGYFRTYLLLPGTLTLRISSPFYISEDVKVELTDDNPVKHITVRLKPQLFTLTVRVLTTEGIEVREGNLSVIGIDVPITIDVDLNKTNRIDGLKTGRYKVVFRSDVFTTKHTIVDLISDMEIMLTVNRTSIRTFFRVLDNSGKPIENAKIVLSLGKASKIEMTTNKLGETQVILIPYGSIVNCTISADEYISRSISFVANLSIDKKPIVITLSRFRGILTIMLRDTEGNALSGSITIKDAMGNEILPITSVIDTYMINLELGTYIITGFTPDGRSTQTEVKITKDMPNAVALLVFEKPPQPLHVVYFPLVLAIVIVSTVAVAIYRKFFRKKIPRIVS